MRSRRTNDRVRESVTTRLSPEETTALYRGLANALTASERPDPERLAVYWAGCGERTRAAGLAKTAADQAAHALAFAHAARLYWWALELGAPEIEAELRIGLGAALANAGRGRDAADAYLAAVPLVPADKAIQLRRLAAEQLLTSGHIDRGLGTLKGVLGELGLRFPESLHRVLLSLLWRRFLLWVRLWLSRRRGGLAARRTSTQAAVLADMRMAACRSATMGLGMVDNLRGADFQTQWLLLAFDAGHEEQIATGLALEACFISTAGTKKARRSRELVAAAERMAERVNRPYPRAMVDLAKGVSATLEARWRSALEAHRRAIALFGEHCTGVAWETETAKLMELWSLWHMGELHELWRLAPVYQRQAEARGDLFASTNFRAAYIADGWLARDEVERTRAEASAVLSAWSHQGFHLQHYYAVYAQVDAMLYEGRGAAAREILLPRLRDMKRALLLLIQFARATMLDMRGRCALAAAREAPPGERGPLLREALRMARALEAERRPSATPMALMLRAGAATLCEQRDRAVELAMQAKESFLAADMRSYAEVAELRAAQLEARADATRADRVDAAQAALRARGVVRVDRFASMLAPGEYA